MEREVQRPPADVLAFYEQSVGEVFAYAMRLTGGDSDAAEELVQDTFLTLVREVRAGRVESVGIGWAITTCRHRFLDDLRGRRRRIERERRVAALAPPAPSEPANDTVDALRVLAPDQRAAMVMRYVDEMPVAEIAGTMGRSVHAVESLLARGRHALRRHVERGSE